jgi:hypothetical protein
MTFWLGFGVGFVAGAVVLFLVLAWFYADSG